MGESKFGDLAKLKKSVIVEAQTLECITTSLLSKIEKEFGESCTVDKQVVLVQELQEERPEWRNLSSTLVLRVATLGKDPCRRTLPSVARFCAALCAKKSDYLYFVLCIFRLLATGQIDSANAAIQQWPQGLDSLPDNIAQAFRCRATDRPNNGIFHKVTAESNLTTLFLSICTLGQTKMRQHMMGPLLQRVCDFDWNPEGAKWALRTLALAARIRGLHRSQEFFAHAIRPIIFFCRNWELIDVAFASAIMALGPGQFRFLRTNMWQLDPQFAHLLDTLQRIDVKDTFIIDVDSIVGMYLRRILKDPAAKQSTIQSKPAVEQKPAKRKGSRFDQPKDLMSIKCDLPLEQHKKPKIAKVSPDQTVKNLLMRLPSDPIAQELEEVCTEIEQIQGELQPENLSRVLVNYFAESYNEKKFNEWTFLTLVLMLRSSGWPDLADLMLPLAISTLSTCTLRKKAEALARTCGRLCPYTEKPEGQAFVLVANLLLSRGQFDLPLVYQVLQNLPDALRTELLSSRPLLCSSLKRIISGAPKESACEIQMISIFLQPFSGAYPRLEIAVLRTGIERGDYDLGDEMQLELVMLALEKGSDWAEDNIVNNLLAPLSRRPESAAWAINTATLIEKAASGLPKLSAAVSNLLDSSTKEEPMDLDKGDSSATDLKSEP